MIYYVLPRNVLHTRMALWDCLQKFEQLLVPNPNTSFQICLEHDLLHLILSQSLSHPMPAKHFSTDLQQFWHSAALHLLMPTQKELHWEE